MQTAGKFITKSNYRKFQTSILVALIASLCSMAKADTIVCSKSYLSVETRQNPLASKSIVRSFFSNIHRWYFKKDSRKFDQPAFNYLSDLAYLRERKNSEKVGIVRSLFSTEFDTRIYYTATGVPNSHGQIPVVDPKSKGLFIYFHGSGTSKASGVNFAYKMNRMAAMGFSVLAIDLPFHADGSRNRKMTEPEHFYGMMNKLIHHYNPEGLPVYLAGHSFGPDLAAEYFKRYPTDPNLAGVLMVSPAGFNKELADWFNEKTVHMAPLWREIVVNEDGAAWAGMLSSKHSWRTPGTFANPDPTLVNPSVKVKVISGEFEEYVPGELDYRGVPTKTPRDYDFAGAIHQLLARADVTIEPGVGHYIFEHTDRYGNDVIIRSMLEIAGENISNEKQLKTVANFNPLPEPQELARKYARDPFFKAWIDSIPKGRTTVLKIAAELDVVSARRLLTDFHRYVVINRERAMIQNIISTKEWNPIFYEQNRTEIDSIDLKKPRLSDVLLNRYYAMLEEISVSARNNHATADANTVYTIPEKKGPPAHVLERMEREKQEGTPDMPPKKAKPNQNQQQIPKPEDETAKPAA
jgi:pimeloyl-ACP methyl ester carboxylesterase